MHRPRVHHRALFSQVALRVRQMFSNALGANSNLKMVGRNALIALLLEEFTEDVVVDQPVHNNRPWT